MGKYDILFKLSPWAAGTLLGQTLCPEYREKLKEKLKLTKSGLKGNIDVIK